MRASRGSTGCSRLRSSSRSSGSTRMPCRTWARRCTGRTARSTRPATTRVLPRVRRGRRRRGRLVRAHARRRGAADAVAAPRLRRSAPSFHRALSLREPGAACSPPDITGSLARGRSAPGRATRRRPRGGTPCVANGHSPRRSPRCRSPPAVAVTDPEFSELREQLKQPRAVRRRRSRSSSASVTRSAQGARSAQAGRAEPQPLPAHRRQLPAGRSAPRSPIPSVVLQLLAGSQQAGITGFIPPGNDFKPGTRGFSLNDTELTISGGSTRTSAPRRRSG